RLHPHRPPDDALEVLACPQRTVEPGRGDLDRPAVEVRPQHARDAFAERMVDAGRVVDVHAEALLARELERQHLHARERRGDTLRNLAIPLSLLAVLNGRHQQKWAPRAHFRPAEMW